MASEALSASEMRVIIALIGVVVLGLIYWFGVSRKPEQGRRSAPRSGNRLEPTLDSEAETDPLPGDKPASEPRQGELPVGDKPAAPATRRRGPLPGRRPPGIEVERIVSLFVICREPGASFHGTNIIVAAEKAGLEFGDMEIFHRTVEHSDQFGPVFSAANMVKPGSFDMASIEHLETPGLSLFMTLPGPLSALDAWDTMLPTAQRLAELLDGQVVDEQQNALGRQRIAWIRDDLRAWDRQHEGDAIDTDRHG
ncbi:MAG TPA: cell division protein ZipA [Rhodanobacteraceae bacterium]|nr:cell division protein ZipA [Rhodanobacteraceae bacterium]